VRGWGGLFNALAIVLFLVNTIQGMRRGRKATAAT